MNAVVVVPFHDPQWLERTLANLRRQSLQLPVVLVLNGGARGLHVDGVETTEAQHTQHADAVNTGAAWARKHGYTHVVLFDSDDYYGAGYTQKITHALERADYCGQREVFVELRNGEVHRMGRAGKSFLFATIGFSVDRFVPVHDVLENCHDWSERMTASGSSSADTGPLEYCYSRHGGNRHWNGAIPDAVVRRLWGPSQNYGVVGQAVCEAPDQLPSSFSPLPTDTEICASLETILGAQRRGQEGSCMRTPTARIVCACDTSTPQCP